MAGVRSVSALPLARLDFENNAAARDLQSRCGFLDAGRSGTQTWRIVFWSLAAVCSIVLVTHDAELASTADARLVLRDGRVVELSEPAPVLR